MCVCVCVCVCVCRHPLDNKNTFQVKQPVTPLFCEAYLQISKYTKPNPISRQLRLQQATNFKKSMIKAESRVKLREKSRESAHARPDSRFFFEEDTSTRFEATFEIVSRTFEIKMLC